MAARDITKFFIYRWRYVVGYSLIGLLLIGMLIFAGLFVPGGLTEEEMRAAVRSDALSLASASSFGITSLPYYLLQAAIFELFGIYEFTIKLPSLILAFFSAIGLILLLRRWFRPNIAVLTSLIAVTTGQFLFIAQSGTPSIMYVFWPILLLSLGTQVTRSKKGLLFWKVAFAVAVGLSLYTPLSIYPLIAVVLAIIFHPHLRAIVRRLSKTKIVVSAVAAGLVVAPLIYLIITTPRLGLNLLGIPTTWPPDISANILTLLKQFFLFWEPSTTTLMTPVFGLGSLLIIGLGIYRLIRTREATRSYLLIFWILCLLPILILNPLFTTVTFVPSVLLLAAGLTSLISYWYRLFPLNPYARVAGLVPIIILVITLVGSGLDRFIYGYHYAPTTAVNFSRDLRLLPSTPPHLVVSADELPFYTAVANHREGMTVNTSPKTTEFVATRSGRASVPSGHQITKIITTTSSENADRLYVYKKLPQ